MAKNIVILSDGTGQGARMPKAERSNVWKLWDATKKAAPAQQVTFYDEGLGAEHKREWWRWAYDLASRATGLGISQNIKDCYTALMEYYELGDRVFLFGFSRGAYTVRSLGGVLALCGIPQRDAAGNSPRDRQNKKGRLALVEEAVEKIYKHYGGKDKEKERNAVESFEFGIATAGNQRRHVQHAPHRSTATPDAAHSLELAAVKVVGRNPDQRRNLPAVHLSEFRQQGEERDGQHRAAAGFQSRRGSVHDRTPVTPSQCLAALRWRG